MIRAECHSDDFAVAVEFDATRYFEQATDQQLVELAACGWGGDYAADAVAQSLAARSRKVARLFRYLDAKPVMGTGDPVGFECHVEPEDAARWLCRHRPKLYRRLRARGLV